MKVDRNLKVGRELRNLAHVPRWTIIQTARNQSVAEHMYFVGIYVSRFLDYIGETDPDFMYACVVGALEHDIDEILTGDIAGPSKRKMFNEESKKTFHQWQNEKMVERFPWYMEEQDQQVRAVISFCDYLEGMAFMAENIRLGATDCAEVYNETLPSVERKAEQTDSILNLEPGTSMAYFNVVTGEILSGRYKVVL